MIEPAENFTLLLQQAEAGDKEAANQLYLLVHDELRAVASRRKRKYQQNVDFPTTALVNDAFMKIVGQDCTEWKSGDRSKFFGYAAKKIHDMLVDAYKAAKTRKRDNGFQKVELEDGGLDPQAAENFQHGQLIIQLKDALEKFETFAPDEGMLFRIKYFLGCTIEEVAEIMDLPTWKVQDGVKKARMWLRRELKDHQNDALE